MGRALVKPPSRHTDPSLKLRIRPMLLLMRITLAGGGGFLGSALPRQFVTDGHEVVVLTRQPAAPPPGPNDAGRRPGVSRVTWIPDGKSGAWAGSLDKADAVVNLSGESIAARRWSAAQKDKIRTSRLLATRSLTAAIRDTPNPPRVFVSGSAVGYYGDRGEETLTEASTPGDDFLATTCRDWENAAAEAAPVARVVFVRTGIVLDRKGGALPKMLPPFL